MVSKNNYSEKKRKISPQRQRYSIRKFTVGAASVLIGLTFMGINNQTVKADTTVAQEESVNVSGNTTGDLEEKIESVADTTEKSAGLDTNTTIEVAQNNEEATTETLADKQEVEPLADNQSVENEKTIVSSTDNKAEVIEQTVVPSQDNNEMNTAVTKAEVISESNATTSTDAVSENNVDTTTTEAPAVDNSVVETTQTVENNVNVESTIEKDAPIEAEDEIKTDIAAIETSNEAVKLSSDSNVKEIQNKASVNVPAVDNSNYPTAAGNLIGNDKYIYQILDLQYTGFKKLVLSVNRNDLNDENLYAYVTNSSYTQIDDSYIIAAGHFRKITVGWQDREFLIVNSGRSNITINGNVVSVGNSTNVSGGIAIEYGLGNINSGAASAIGEIIPVHTEQSVIKYYYYDNNGKLVEISASEKYPNVTVSGWTGQKFTIENVEQYKQLIEGFYLDDSQIQTGAFTGTISQFGDGSYYKKVYYTAGNKNEGFIDQLTVDYTVVYRQIDASGKMEVLMYDKNNMNNVIERHEVAAGQSVKFTNHNYTARNPFVTDSAHEVQFIYKDLGKLIPVDENGNQIGDAIKFNNDLTDPTKAGMTFAPVIQGYLASVEYVIPQNPGDDIKVVYRLREDAKATLTFIDIDNDLSINKIDTTGKVYEQIVFNDLEEILDTYTKKGYVVVSNTFNPGTKFDVTDLDFVIQLKHVIEAVNESETVNKVINYVDSVGNVLHNSITQSATFTAHGYKDKVTGKLVLITGVQHVGENLIADKITNKDVELVWQVDKENFESIQSPDIVGYITNQKWSTTNKVDQNQKLITEDIIYDKKAQVGTIVFWDETSQKQLGSTINIAGNYGEIIEFRVIDDVLNKIKEYETNNYVLVTNPLAYTTTFGDADYNPGCNDYKVILKHKIETNSQSKEINRVITYIYADGPNVGQQAASSTIQKVIFIGEGMYDFVDNKWIGDITWKTESGDDHYVFSNVTSPIVSGYEANRPIVAEFRVDGTFDKDTIVEEVLYSASQKVAEIQFIDDVTGKVINSDKVTGKVDYIINWNISPVDVLQQFQNNGYKFVSSNYEFGKDYYYSAEDAKNSFIIHLTRDLINIDPTDPDNPAYGSEDFNKEVVQEIQYVFENGKPAATTNKQTISFTAFGVIDKTTGKYVLLDENGKIVLDENGEPVEGELKWVANVTNPQFSEVVSPTIVGYTPDKLAIGATNVTHTTPNSVIVVKYTANEADAQVVFVDKTTGKELETVTLSGKYGEAINYSTADKIKYYESLGYELVKDGYDQDGKFGHETSKYYVTFKHGTVVITPENPGKPDEPIDPSNPDGPKYPTDSANLNKDVTHTIHYVYADGTTARPSHTQTLTFTASGVIDKVTGQYVEVDENGNVKLDANGNPVLGKLTWTASDGTTFIAVVSPIIVGYTADKATVGAIEGINQDSKNLVTKVVYTANEADAQVVFVDKTTGKKLETVTLSGKYGEAINYSTADKIKYYENLGYELVENGYTGGEFGEETKVFIVTFKHGVIHVHPENPGKPDDPINPENPDGPKYPTDSATLNKDVTHTIHYVYADGTPARPSHTQTLTFTGSGHVNKVTGQYVEVDDEGNVKLDSTGQPIPGKLNWIASLGNSFLAVTSPEILGHTPSHSQVDGVENVAHDSENYVYTVTYTANDAKAEIIYVDETTGKELETAVVDGKYNENIGYSTADKIKYYESLGYELVKDGYDQDGKFGHEKSKYYVTFKHGTVVITPENPGKPDEPIDPSNPDGSKYPTDSANLNKDVTHTIHYVYADGTPARPSHTQTLTFTASGVIDKVTGQYVEVDENGNVKLDANGNPVLGKLTWTASDGTTFIAVVSPTIDGYTADKITVGAIEGINQDSQNLVTKVVYTANDAKAEIIYIDETTGKELETAVVDGKYNENIGYSTADKIKYYEGLGYELVKDGYDQDSKFGHETNKYYVTFKHGTITVTPDDNFTKDDPINPDSPDGPKYPFDSIALDKTIKRTIKYVYADGTKAKDDVVQTLRFRGTAVIDKVTGEIIILDENGRKVSDGIKWTALDGTTFVEIISPTIDGYIADKKEIGRIENVDSNTEDISETVVYSKNTDEPTKPVEPETPVKPGEPTEPVKPENPVKPEEPTVPEKPAIPETPSEPSNGEPAVTPSAKSDDLPEQIKKLSTSGSITEKIVSDVEEQKSEEVKTEADDKSAATLPQTGTKKYNAGLIGLGLATIASILGLAGTKKRKKD